MATVESAPAAVTKIDETWECNLANAPVHLFGKEHKEVKHPENFDATTLLGGKGKNLALMSDMGLSVPPGLTITTEVCSAFHKGASKLPSSVWPQVLEGMKLIEKEMSATFGDSTKPLLVSVRSGAAISMPGMMDTVLNLGINDETVKGLTLQFGERFAMDSYRRFLNMFGTVVMEIPHSDFEHILTQKKVSLTTLYTTMHPYTFLFYTLIFLQFLIQKEKSLSSKRQ